MGYIGIVNSWGLLMFITYIILSIEIRPNLELMLNSYLSYLHKFWDSNVGFDTINENTDGFESHCILKPQQRNRFHSMSEFTEFSIIFKYSQINRKQTRKGARVTEDRLTEQRLRTETIEYKYIYRWDIEEISLCVTL